MANDKLSWKQRRLLALLGLPAFGVAPAYTVVTTYLPVLIERLSGPAVTGILIAGEGLFALFLPVVVGQWSDSLRTSLGGRMPFMFAAAALAVPALVVMPLGSDSLIIISAALTVFFVAYFVYYSPYYALFPDMVPEDMRGRSQGTQGALRSAGLLLALVGGACCWSCGSRSPFWSERSLSPASPSFSFMGCEAGLVNGKKARPKATRQTGWRSGSWCGTTRASASGSSPTPCGRRASEL